MGRRPARAAAHDHAFYDRVEHDESMVAHHVDLAITPAQRHRFVALMSLAADDAQLPDDPEFRAAVLGYVEWGTRIAMTNSQPGAAVVPHAPVPHWGWGVAPPWTG